MELAQHPAVVGASKRSGLFSFTISPVFADRAVSESTTRSLSSYLDRPERVLNLIWARPDRSLHALGDGENPGRCKRAASTRTTSLSLAQVLPLRSCGASDNTRPNMSAAGVANSPVLFQRVPIIQAYRAATGALAYVRH